MGVGRLRVSYEIMLDLLRIPKEMKAVTSEHAFDLWLEHPNIEPKTPVPELIGSVTRKGDGFLVTEIYQDIPGSPPKFIASRIEEDPSNEVQVPVDDEPSLEEIVSAVEDLHNNQNVSGVMNPPRGFVSASQSVLSNVISSIRPGMASIRLSVYGGAPLRGRRKISQFLSVVSIP